jgi:hypothetical protein
MANTTNYNWETPDDTDLVKDGAAAIRTLGSSVDTTTKALNPSTTLGDIEYRSSTANTNTRLAIGTTGQVLTVSGGVPAWATSDDANAIQNAIVDAKGDLIGATAADTPARLAVGADYGFLQAIAAESTGLKWNSGAWTGFTPTVTAQSGTATTVSAEGAYQRIGKTCIYRAYVSVTDKGTADGNMFIELPFTTVNKRQSGTGADINLNGFAASVLVESSASSCIVRKYAFTPFCVHSVGIAWAFEPS